MQKKPQTTKHCKEQRSDRKIINRHEIFIKRINICYQTYKSSISSNLSYAICHLTCKVANKCLNVCERVEVV